MPFQYRPQWIIPGAGTSETVLNFAGVAGDAQDMATATGLLFQGLASVIPNDVAITFPSEVSELDTVTGELQGITNVDPPDTVNGGVTGVWAGGVGALIRWETGVIAFGRRQIGRTFVVPIGAALFDSGGTLSPSALSDLQAAANDFLNALEVAQVELVVWSRAHGVENFVQQATIPDRSAILRERRDD